MRIGFGPSNGAGSESGGGGHEEPPPDVYEAVVCCIEDVGMHEERNTPGVTKQKLVIGFEIDWRNTKGSRPALFKKVNANLWSNADGSKKSELRSLLDIIIPNRVSETQRAGKDIDTDQWVGQTVRVTVEHDARGRAVIRGFVKSKLAQGSMRPERDWKQPFGLWKWLLDNRVS